MPAGFSGWARRSGPPARRGRLSMFSPRSAATPAWRSAGSRQPCLRGWRRRCPSTSARTTICSTAWKRPSIRRKEDLYMGKRAFRVVNVTERAEAEAGLLELAAGPVEALGVTLRRAVEEWRGQALHTLRYPEER